ncbi:MAG: formylglycine-generating enzyme family protein [bacterium]
MQNTTNTTQWSTIVSACVLLSLVACRDNPANPPAATTTLEIVADTFKTFAGGQIQLTAMATLSGGETRDVSREGSWSVSPGLAGAITQTGLFQAFSNKTGRETVQFAFQSQTATVEIDVEQGATRFTTRPAFVHVQAGDGVQFEGLATFVVPGSPTRLEFVTDEVSWALMPNNVVAEMTVPGLLQTFPGVAAPETVTVQATFTGLTITSTAIVQPVYDSPFEMERIPAGSFLMGDANGRDDEQPEHEVFLDAYDIGKFEITNAEYIRFLNLAFRRGDIVVDNGQIFPLTGPYLPFFYMSFSGIPGAPEFIKFEEGGFDVVMASDIGSFPVTRITWFGAAAFCDFFGLRLPTEAEWERASRADQRLEFGTADGTLTHDLANYDGVGGKDIFTDLAPVGTFAPNPFGLFDLAGNVAEHVFDEYAADFYSRSPSSNPIGPGSARPVGRFDLVTVVRGGGSLSSASFCRSAVRVAYNNFSPANPAPAAELAFARFGFRVARSVQE